MSEQTKDLFELKITYRDGSTQIKNLVERGHYVYLCAMREELGIESIEANRIERNIENLTFTASEWDSIEQALWVLLNNPQSNFDSVCNELDLDKWQALQLKRAYAKEQRKINDNKVISRIQEHFNGLPKEYQTELLTKSRDCCVDLYEQCMQEIFNCYCSNADNRQAVLSNLDYAIANIKKVGELVKRDCGLHWGHLYDVINDEFSYASYCIADLLE